MSLSAPITTSCAMAPGDKANAIARTITNALAFMLPSFQDSKE
jgi:hypothetical protein